MTHDLDRSQLKLTAAEVRVISAGPQTLPASNAAVAGIRALYFQGPALHPLELVLHLDALLRRHALRQRVRILWKVNNTFLFEHGHNAIVLQTHAPNEAVAHIERLRARPKEEREIRAAGATTARHFACERVINRNLMPQLELSAL